MQSTILLIITHFIGDFYHQTKNTLYNKYAIADKSNLTFSKRFKKILSNFKYLLLSAFLYTVPFTILFSLLVIYQFTGAKNIHISTAIIFFSHLTIEIACNLLPNLKRTIVLILGQVIHLIIIKVIANYYISFKMPENLRIYLVACLCVLLLCIPASLIISSLLDEIFGEQKSNQFDPGIFIGIFERLIVFILAYFGSFATIAIIISIKTWARSEDLKGAAFRNKYLFGTLASLAISLICFVLFKIIK